MNQAPDVLAIDDGHSETKIVFQDPHTLELRCTSFASKAQRGVDKVANESGKPPPFYICGRTPSDTRTPEKFTIHPRTSPTKVDNRYRGYPKSAQNRVIVRHAINEACRYFEQIPSAISIATTLPFSDFYAQSNELNTALIASKKDNIAGPVWLADPVTGEGLPSIPEVHKHSIFPEGMMAFFDRLFIRDDATGKMTIDTVFTSRFTDGTAREFIIVDIGGKTTDVIRAEWNGDIRSQPLINKSASSSLQLGVGRVGDVLEAELRHHHDAYDIGDTEAVLWSRKWSYLGQVLDVRDHVARAITQIGSLIIDELRPRTDGHHLAAAIILCGGGIQLMPAIADMFPEQQRIIPAEPQYANARGMLKSLIRTREHHNA